jgi:hypothetical protein
VSTNFVAKEIWLSFDFVTHRGMVEEKALVDSGANKNCIDIKTTEKLGIKPRLLPQPMGLRNVDGTNNRRGWIKYWLPVAWFQGGRARMLKFLIIDLGRDRIILRYPVTVLAMVRSGLPVHLRYMCLDLLTRLGQDQTSLIPVYFRIACIWFFLSFEAV